MENKRVVIIGGGAAGMMAAIYASDGGARVTLIEKGNACGRKLRITGKGRCNVTNDSALPELLQNIPTNPRFLYSAFSFLSSEELQAFFENEGVPLKVERGKRVFPVSDKAEDIVRCLVSACRKRGVETIFGRCERILTENGAVSGVTVDSEDIPADSVILATGGLSYPRTGSDGDGFKMAKALGHSVTELKPSLVPIVSRSRICAEMQGLSLKNVSMSVTLAPFSAAFIAAIIPAAPPPITATLRAVSKPLLISIPDFCRKRRIRPKSPQDGEVFR
jgi:predicted Rossmann fold flavoprotein